MEIVWPRRLVTSLPASLKVRDTAALAAATEVAVLLGYMLLYIWRIEPQKRGSSFRCELKQAARLGRHSSAKRSSASG